MISIFPSTMYVVMVVIGLIFFIVPTASAHMVSTFSIQPDSNYVDPATHFELTKENHPHIILQRDSVFTLPMVLKSDGNGTGMTSYLFHITDGNDFTAETMPTGMSIYVVPNHLLVPNGFNQTFNIVIKAGKNTPSGIYAPNLVTKWNNNNITRFMDVDPVYFQVGQWNWDSLSRQLERGISANDVVCKSDLHLIIKSEDGSPACVKPDTANVLIERSWAKASQ